MVWDVRAGTHAENLGLQTEPRNRRGLTDILNSPRSTEVGSGSQSLYAGRIQGVRHERDCEVEKRNRSCRHKATMSTKN